MSRGKEDSGAPGGLYKWYVLGVVSAGYIMGELAHFITGTTSKAMAQDMHYGDVACMLNVSTGLSVTQLPVVCETVNSTDKCVQLSVNGTRYCEWGYNGLGMDYQILAGPAFMAVYTIGGVVVGIIADKFNRSITLGICTLIFSAALLLMGACTKYWHLVILRMVIAAGESGCNPLASGILTDMFPEDQLALALSIYNWGIFVGFGISFPVGRYVTDANIWGLGWRMCYYLSGGVSMIVVLLTFFTLREPKRIAIGLEKEAMEKKGAGLRRPSALVREYPGGMGSAISLEPIKLPETRTSVFRIMIEPRMILLCIVATMRNSGGNSFAYNTDLFYRKYYPDSDLSWALFFISVVVGSFGVLAGGIISDKLVTRMGVRSRLLVLSVSQLIASPFAFGSVTFEPTWAMFSLAVSYFFAEMWLGNFYAVLVEIVPLSVRSTAVGVFLFIMNNISGNLPIAIDPVSKWIGYREALWIFYAGFYFASSILFFVTMFMMPKPLKTEEVEPEGKELMEYYSNKPTTDVKC